jgi:hypothetical protein
MKLLTTCWQSPVIFTFFGPNITLSTLFSYTLKLRGCIQKFPDWVDNETDNNKHSLRSNTKGYGGKNH